MTFGIKIKVQDKDLTLDIETLSKESSFEDNRIQEEKIPT